MTDDEEGVRPLMRSRVADLLVRAVGGDDSAEEALVELAARDRLAGWALVVVLELQVASAEGAGGLPLPSPEVEERLDAAARSIAQAAR